MREHPVPKLRWQVGRGQQIDTNAKQRFQFALQARQVKQALGRTSYVAVLIELDTNEVVHEVE